MHYMPTKLGAAVQQVHDVNIHFYEAPIGPIFQQRAASIFRAIPASEARSRDTFQVMGDPGILLTSDQGAMCAISRGKS